MTAEQTSSEGGEGLSEAEVFALAKVLSAASPEFADRAAKNHMAQARRLLASGWLTDRLAAVEAERDANEADLDDVAGRLSDLLCELTDGLMSKTGYPVRTMVQAVEAVFEKQEINNAADLIARAESAEAALATALGRLGAIEAEAFIAGWFAHARNPQRLVVEDAWHAYRIGDLCPGCLRKPCACPMDEDAARAIFKRAALANPMSIAGEES